MKKTLTNQAVNAKVTKLDLEHPRVIPHTRSFTLAPGGGPKSADWSTYDTPGTNRVDTVQDVALGAGPGAGTYIAVGNQGRVGTIKQYNAAGALINTQLAMPAPGNRVVIKGTATHPVSGNKYVLKHVFTAAGAFVNSFVECYPPLAGGAGFSVAWPPNVQLNAITVRNLSRAPLEISVAGTVDIGAGHDVLLISHMDTNLTGIVDVALDFGTATQGLSLATDDSDTRYAGARLDNSGIGQPLNVALASDDSTLPWGGGFIWSLGSPSDRASTGFYGMTAVAGQLYMSGRLPDFAFNPAISPDTQDYENNVIANVSASDGVTAVYAFGYGISGGDYGSDDSDVTPSGHLVTTGSADTYAVQTDAQALTVGDLSQFDAAGAPIAFRDTGDCDGTLNKDTDGRGVAIDPSGDVLIGGITNAGKVSFEAGLCPTGNPPQLLSGDSTYGPTGSPPEGPPSDGYVFKDNNPVGT